MLSHCTLGTNDLEKAEAFYNDLLSLFNAAEAFRTERAIFYRFDDNGTMLSISKPFDGQPATRGNGSMVALAASSEDQVKAVHARALELGGTSEGEPGIRGSGDLAGYAAYFRDPEGIRCLLYGAVIPGLNVVGPAPEH